MEREATLAPRPLCLYVRVPFRRLSDSAVSQVKGFGPRSQALAVSRRRESPMWWRFLLSATRRGSLRLRCRRLDHVTLDHVSVQRHRKFGVQLELVVKLAVQV